MQDLGVRHVYQNQLNKIPAFEALLAKLNLNPEQVAYVGDDLPDLPILRRVGLAIAVADAYDYIKAHVHYITNAIGGYGAVREVCDLLMQAQGQLDSINQQFLQSGAILNHGK
jgi:3-deoxy-D-manno-octulosonate 8-phosphate phosphatase (KDO 8-P phosphatase)